MKWTILTGKKLGSGPKNVEKTVFWGFPTSLQENASQTCCNNPIELKFTGQPLIYCKRCAYNKIDHFSCKKNRFWAKKCRKNGFYGVFRRYFKKTLRKLAVLLRLSSNLQGIRLFDCKRCAINKIDHYTQKKERFSAKERRKNGFSGVFDITSGKRFANLLYRSD